MSKCSGTPGSMYRVLADGLEELTAKGDAASTKAESAEARAAAAEETALEQRGRAVIAEARLANEKQRAESAEARASLAERLAGERKQELSYAHQEKLGLEEELEAARARVGFLERTYATQSRMWSEATERAEAELEAARARVWELDRGILWFCTVSGRTTMDVETLRAKVTPLPTPAAPTPAVVDGLPCSACGRRAMLGTPRNPTGNICSGCGADKESPPRDSGGELVGRWRCTCCKAEAHATEVSMLAAWRALVPNGVLFLQHRCPGNHPQCGWFNAERIDDGRHEARAEAPETAGLGAAAREVDGPSGVHDAGHVAASGEAEKVAPPGLTPEEAEAGARRVHEMFLNRSREWDELNDYERADATQAYRFAHSEGAKAAKEGGKPTPSLRGHLYLNGYCETCNAAEPSDQDCPGEPWKIKPLASAPEGDSGEAECGK